MVGTSLPILITLNPYGHAPLTALATAEMPVLGKFSLKVLGQGEEGIPISHDFTIPSEPVLHSSDDSIQFQIPVLGLYPDHENRVVFTFKSPEGQVRLADTVTISTPTIPLNPDVNVVVNNLPADYDDLYFVSNLQAGFDQRGAVRWIYTGNAQYLFRRMENGNLLMTSDENLVSYHNEKFMEITIFGETLREYTVPNRMHHEVRQMPNGNFLVATNSNRYEGNGNDGRWEEGVVVEMNRQTGEVVKEWDFNQILDTNRNRPPGGNPDDLLHINTVYYDETDDSIVISSKH